MARLKEKAGNQAKRTRNPAVRLVKETAETPEDGVILELWSEAVRELRSLTFADMDQAITAIVEAVMQRMDKDELNTAEVRQFLFDLMDTDPELQAELRRILAIK